MKFPHHIILEIALEAGRLALEKSESVDFIQYNYQGFPQTDIDKLINNLITEKLMYFYPEIPVVSEECEKQKFAIRKKWKYMWLVDPLDGTKEYIKGSKYYTINIALIKNGNPLGGVVFAPAIREIYWTNSGISYSAKTDKIGILDNASIMPLNDFYSSNVPKIIVCSSDHLNKTTLNYLNSCKKIHSKIKILKMGSSYKICMVASGKADLYPRLSYSSEWDIAAAFAVAMYAKVKVYKYYSKSKIIFNKRSFRNPYIVFERANKC